MVPRPVVGIVVVFGIALAVVHTLLVVGTGTAVVHIPVLAVVVAAAVAKVGHNCNFHHHRHRCIHIAHCYYTEIGMNATAKAMTPMGASDLLCGEE